MRARHVDDDQCALFLQGGAFAIAAEGRRVEVNDSGVVVAGMEALVLENPKKGWKGCPVAEIEVAPIAPGRWAWSTAYQLSQQGASGPICVDGPLSRCEPTREAAIAAAVASLRAQMGHAREFRSDPLIGKILAWLDRGCA